MTGLDLSQEMIQAFEESMPAPLKPQVRFIVGDAEEFLLQNQDEYNVIVLSAVLHHLFDYESVLRQKKGRRSMVSPPDHLKLKETTKRILRKLIR